MVCIVATRTKVLSEPDPKKLVVFKASEICSLHSQPTKTTFANDDLVVLQFLTLDVAVHGRWEESSPVVLKSETLEA